MIFEPTIGVKWIATAGLLVTAAGLMQMDVAELFEKLLAHYRDERKYPYGPPSYINRHIITDPDEKMIAACKRVLFSNPRIGFYLILIGTLAQIPSLWF